MYTARAQVRDCPPGSHPKRGGSMADRSAIDQLFADDGWPMDSREFSVLGDTFTEDADFTIVITGGDTIGPISGRDAIVDFCSSTVGERLDQRRHVITNVRIGPHQTETSAEVTAILTPHRRGRRGAGGQEQRPLPHAGSAGRRRLAVREHAPDARPPVLTTDRFAIARRPAIACGDDQSPVGRRCARDPWMATFASNSFASTSGGTRCQLQ